jgi:hypothetical protein
MNKFGNITRPLQWFTALLIVAFVAGCGGSGNGSGSIVISSAKAITAFSLAGVTGTINEPAKTISVDMPYGTAVTALVATSTNTGTGLTVGSVVQTSGTTANDFTAPVAYQVSAADNSTATYIVTVTVASISAKALTAYSIAGVAGMIDEAAKTIAVAVPNGTAVTALVATFTTTGANASVGAAVQTSGTTSNDFTSPVAYTVTAGDGSTVIYTVTVTVAAAAGSGVNLGTAGNYVILASSAISTVPASAITGNVALSPASASFITGFTLVADSTNVFSTSTQVVGQVFAADYATPTPANLTTAVLDMQAAYTDAAGRAPTSAATTNVGAGILTGLTLAPGVYEWGTAVTIPTDLVLNGTATDVWIFKVAGTLDLASAKSVLLSGGALPKNVFWQVAGAVTIGTTAHMEGVILSQTAITLQTGASANSRLLAQTAVALDGNAVTQPAP